MNAKEFFSQACRLDDRIDSDIKELQDIREMLVSASPPRQGEKVQFTQGTNASFTGGIEKIQELENKIAEEVVYFAGLKDKIRDVIGTVTDPDEQAVLRCRYINNMTWDEVAVRLRIDSRTARRWHSRALENAVLPEETPGRV